MMIVKFFIPLILFLTAGHAARAESIVDPRFKMKFYEYVPGANY